MQPLVYSLFALVVGASACGDDAVANRDVDEASDLVLEAFSPTDTAAPDSAALVDVATDVANGQACGSNTECSSGWCSPTAAGPLCVAVCVDECPEGFRCVPASNGATDPVFVCQPTTVTPPPDASVGLEDAPSNPDTVADAEDVVIADATASDDATSPDDSGVIDVDPPEDGGIISDGDYDDDGIPDDEDNLPCLAIYLVVYNEGVSSGSMSLNGTEVIGANAFPTDEPIVVWLNPTSGDNALSLGGKLTGSPSDSMSLEVLDTAGVLYFATLIVREGGSPRDYTFTFTVEATCP